jgi:DNA-directed RNA polymerase specialized sigma24 family protein
MLKELSTTEVAGLLDISEACAKTRLHRAQALLRRRLEDAPASFGWANAIGGVRGRSTG